VSEAITISCIASPGLTWTANDLSGTGAARNPGRWNSRDRPIVYSSSSIALACLVCRRLSWRTGKNYTLPSESQWEYACRGGTTTPYAFGESLGQRQANVSTSQRTELGMFPANAWSLHDMHGNLWEWCADHGHENYVNVPDDGSAWTDPNADLSKGRLLRGDSWFDDPGYYMDSYPPPSAAMATLASASAVSPQDQLLSPYSADFSLGRSALLRAFGLRFLAGVVHARGAPKFLWAWNPLSGPLHPRLQEPPPIHVPPPWPAPAAANCRSSRPRSI
jgi:hypothetical protein